MVVITYSNVADRGSELVRDILRNNLTDPVATERDTQTITHKPTTLWIFKEPPKRMDFYPPWVIVSGNNDYKFEGLSPISMLELIDGMVVFNISVIANKVEHRDTIREDIFNTIKDPTSSDSNGETLIGNNLKISKIPMVNASTYNEDTDEMLYSSRISVLCKFINY